MYVIFYSKECKNTFLRFCGSMACRLISLVVSIARCHHDTRHIVGPCKCVPKIPAPILFLLTNRKLK